MSIYNLFNFFRGETVGEPEEKPVEKEKRDSGLSIFSTHSIPVTSKDDIEKRLFGHVGWLEEMQRKEQPQMAMDAGEPNTPISIKSIYSLANSSMSEALLAWYANQSFIGYQACAIIAQNWLIDKACNIAGKAATRNGWKVVSADDERKEGIEDLTQFDDEMRVTANLVEFSHMCRVFGIRIALFDIETDDPEFYEKPFNLDGVKPGSYKGISQVDPYWCVPMLTTKDVNHPYSRHFYEPEFWDIGGRKFHRSHLVISRYAEVPDILKPTYLYGGLPLTQMIAERVYCAERTANEAPQLTLTKRMNVRKTDLSAVVSNPERTRRAMEAQSFYRDNYGQLLIGQDDEYQQHETTLADLDSVIMTQFQLVAAVADVPATELIGTSPKGFNATGEFEKKSYDKSLKSIQKHELEPLLMRHYQLMAKSYVEPKLGYMPDFKIEWNPLDEPTEAEIADNNLKKAQHYRELLEMGAISADDVTKNIIKDPKSGFDEVTPEEPYYDEEEGIAGASTELSNGFGAQVQGNPPQNRPEDVLGQQAENP